MEWIANASERPVSNTPFAVHVPGMVHAKQGPAGAREREGASTRRVSGRFGWCTSPGNGDGYYISGVTVSIRDGRKHSQHLRNGYFIPTGSICFVDGRQYSEHLRDGCACTGGAVSSSGRDILREHRGCECSDAGGAVCTSGWDSLRECRGCVGTRPDSTDHGCERDGCGPRCSCRATGELGGDAREQDTSPKADEPGTVAREE